MNIKEKTLQLKKDFDDVYNKAWQDGNGEGYVIGKEQGYSEGYSQSESDFGDVVQNYGERTTYQYAFCMWSCEYIRPKYFIKIGKRSSSNRIVSVFAYNKKLKKIEKEYFDFSEFIPVTTPVSSTDGIYNLCAECSALEEFEDIGLQGGAYYRTWNGCRKLKTIEVMRCVASGLYSAPFSYCENLENITIEGEIGTNFDIYHSPLSTASIVSIIEHLSDTSGATLTLNTNAKDNMVFPYTSPYTNITYTSWDELIATKTNWTISTTTS